MTSPFLHRTLPFLRRLLIGALFAVCVAMLACDDPIDAETQAFEAAEIHYQQGHYDAALQGYENFVERYPQSPLARTARLRLRSIHHEVSSIMDRHAWPPPSYHGYQGEQSPSPSEQEGFSIDDWLGSPTPPAGD